MTSTWKRNVTRLLLAALAGAFLLTGVSSSQRAASGADRGDSVRVQAVLAATSTPARWRAIELAETQKGCWYRYGHAGPCGSGYDCSGLVSWAYGKVGLHFGRSTDQMLASGRLVRTSSPKWGDLVFWSGHVEFYSSGKYSYGAQKSGTRVAFHHYWGSYRFYHVKGSG